MIALLIIVVLLALLLQYLGQRRGLDGLEASLSFSEPLVEPEAQFDLILHLKNHNWAFFPFLRVVIRLPGGITVDAPQTQLRPDNRGGQTLSVTTWLSPRQQLSRRISLSADARGRYLVQGLTVDCGDFLGLSEQRQSYQQFLEVVALPKEAPEQDMGRISGGFPGDLSVNRFLYEDPVLTVGYRDYTGREPMKMLSWTQMARTGKLMVKQYDYTLETSVTVILNVECRGEHPEPLIEACYSLARTLCRQLEERGIHYAFQTNAVTAGDFASWQSVGEGLGQRHLLHILEGLGRGLYQPARSCEALLERAVRSSDGTHGLLFLTPENDPEVLRLAALWADRAGVGLWTLTGQEVLPC
ncbi:MAG: DUF58 domain-containing protein [Clostridiales bacterium]|nr:DUF58 domain-containing protein [Clostridiales bacterium]